MSKTVYLNLPASEEEVRALEVGDLVYLKGTIFTTRDRAYARAVECIKEGKAMPMDYNRGALWHCGPIMKQREDGKWDLEVAGSTTSSRFSDRAAFLIRAMNQRITVGKGTMNQPVVEAMQDVGGVFLCSTGGCAALYAEQIDAVNNVYWEDLGMVDSVWEFETSCMGPFVVNIDSHGNSIYVEQRKEVRKRVLDYYARKGIDPEYEFTYLPKRTPGMNRK